MARVKLSRIEIALELVEFGMETLRLYLRGTQHTGIIPGASSEGRMLADEPVQYQDALHALKFTENQIEKLEKLSSERCTAVKRVYGRLRNRCYAKFERTT